MKEYYRLKEIRKERNMSITDIAGVLNSKESDVVAWEEGKKSMPTQAYVKLAIYYNLSLDYIAGLTDEKIKLF